MKKSLFSISLLIIYFSIGAAQPDIKREYQAKLNEFNGKLGIQLRSEDIIEYKLEIFTESGNLVFKQDGFAINHLLKKLNKFGSEQLESKDGKQVSAQQYFELCSCKEWLNFKIAEDLSIVKIDCPESLILRIFGKNVNSIKSKQTFGKFYLKN
jgi:hypothetical protein